MAKFYPELTESLQQFIAEQHIFFTATAPTNGRVNLSPKGINTFRVLTPQTVAYLDLTGSGNESSAHLIENGRMTIMFCSFQDAPLILRLYGKGQVIRPGDEAWQDLLSGFPMLPGTRQLVTLAIASVQTSCGLGVPVYDFVSDRSSLIDWATHKGSEGLQEYWRVKNQVSIDGLPTHLLREP
ncbi:pyridoxamine 5'-phosphate oxidase family protein [Myxacorys almedinensis]|uniref:Pyridoxamine 5'-phosphate oxidase family protein n=1 Tax=Myxacorys almedinensis A TaxID=2690445 RepID=A0A8J7Z673_9CYAN|nr:pyridoxamine 5'-phosphate oxidase family protein [Myxacorys almedinensis]NDJ18641.1 pyridoxamine 5'-phosphate oxidase family protein [Myxacorys almedinensis A]